MAFVKVKKLKNNTYADLVENKRKDGKVIQKKLKYLGKVYFLKFIGEIDPVDVDSVHKYSELVNLIVVRKLSEYGFKHENSFFEFEDVRFDSKGLKFLKNVVLKFEDGYFCNYYISKLKNFKQKNDESTKEMAVRLQDLFIKMGLGAYRDEFIGVYSFLTQDADLE